MPQYCECFCKAMVWAFVPVWLPIYLITVPPIKCCQGTWRKHIGPLHEYRVLKPVAKQRSLRRKLSIEALAEPQQQTDDMAVSNEKQSEKALINKADVAANTATGSAAPCGFWKLPFELRLMIWRELLLLEYKGWVEVCLFSNKPNKINLFSYDAVRNLDAKVLRLDRRFYLEGMDILYRQNNFRMRSEATLSSFARRVAPSRLAQIRTLHFAVHHYVHRAGRHRRNLTLNTEVWKDACEDLRQFTGLSELHITLKLDLASLQTRVLSEPEWARKNLFARVLDPLTPVRVQDGGDFTVGYTWQLGVCDSWPEGTFAMRHIPDSHFYWF